MSGPFRHPLRVRFHECDPQGIVFNAHFLAYADIAMTELYRDAFGSWQEAVDGSGVDMVVAEANVRFLAPLRFDEEVELVATVTRLGTTGTTTEIAVERDGSAVAVVTLRHVIVDAESRVKTPIPDSWRTALAPYSNDPA